MGATCTRVARSVPGAAGRPHTCTTAVSTRSAAPLASPQTVALSVVTRVPITVKLPSFRSMADTAPRSSAAETTVAAMPLLKSASTLPAMRALMPICSSVVSSRLKVALSVL
ncbi:hypothetical protein D3C72_1866160 [compost metagenome]